MIDRSRNPDLGPLRLGSSRSGLRLVCEVVTQTARLMVGVPDYQTYVAHTRAAHPDKPVMTYEQFFRERQAARYTISKGRFRGCC